VPAFAARIASANTLDGQPDAFGGSVALNGLDAVGGTVRLESARLKLAYRPEENLVDSNAEDE
jgi:hypothetical protein